jgi:hypothetical protein
MALSSVSWPCFSASRFDTRRELIVQETNAIGTAWLRLDLLPEATQPQIRDAFRAYLDARLAFYKDLGIDRAKALDELGRSEKLQAKIWSESLGAAKQTLPAVLTLIVGSLNEMIDITTTRLAALQTHPRTDVCDAGAARPDQLTDRRIPNR